MADKSTPPSWVRVLELKPGAKATAGAVEGADFLRDDRFGDEESLDAALFLDGITKLVGALGTGNGFDSKIFKPTFKFLVAAVADEDPPVLVRNGLQRRVNSVNDTEEPWRRADLDIPRAVSQY